MDTVSAPGNRAPRGTAAMAGGCVLGPRREIPLEDQLGGDTLKLPQWVLWEVLNV